MTEYTLFPIKKNDVDWPLYRMVTCFLKYRYGINEIPYDDLFESLCDDKKREHREIEYLFVFPSEELTLAYTEDILDQDAIILKYFFPIDWSDVYLDSDGDDDSMIEIVPMEYFYQEGNGSLELQHAQTEIPSKMPCIRYNGDSFMVALGRVLAFLHDRNLTATPWFERLQTVKLMFEGQANELHILHNAGLFDHATLWSWLNDQGISRDDVEVIKALYVSELKKYAMFVLNELDWDTGTTVGEHDFEERKNRFKSFDAEQLEKNKTERNRRQRLMSERQQQNRPPKTPKKIPKPTPKPLGGIQFETRITYPKSQRPRTDTTIAPDKKLLLRNALIMIAVAIVSIVLYIVIGPMTGIDPEKAGEIHWGTAALVLMVAMRLTIISNGYKHHHTIRFRCFSLALCVVLAVLFYFTGLWFMRAIRFLAPPTQTFLIILSIGLTSILLATINRHCVTTEIEARPYSIWIITAVAALIGNFLAVVYA